MAEFSRLSNEFQERDAVVLGGSTDNEFCKLAWRRDHKDLQRLPIWQFADTKGSLVDGLGVRSPDGVAYRSTISLTLTTRSNTSTRPVGRAPNDALRVLLSFARVTGKSVAKR